MEVKGHVMFVEAVFLLLHRQMDGVCVGGQWAQLENDCESAPGSE